MTASRSRTSRTLRQWSRDTLTGITRTLMQSVVVSLMLLWLGLRLALAQMTALFLTSNRAMPRHKKQSGGLFDADTRDMTPRFTALPPSGMQSEQHSMLPESPNLITGSPNGTATPRFRPVP